MDFERSYSLSLGYSLVEFVTLGIVNNDAHCLLGFIKFGSYGWLIAYLS